MVCREPALKTVQDCPFGELAQHGVISHTDGSCVGVLFSGVRMFVYANDIENTDAATITKLDTEMIHNEFGKPICLRSKVKVTIHNECCSSDRTHYCHWLYM